jgi:hypothetical protein
MSFLILIKSRDTRERQKMAYQQGLRKLERFNTILCREEMDMVLCSYDHEVAAIKRDFENAKEVEQEIGIMVDRLLAYLEQYQEDRKQEDDLSSIMNTMVV